jgi:hypothetical protein
MEDNKDIDVNENKDKENKDNDTITISQADLDKKIQQAIYKNSQNEKKKYERELEKQKSLIGLDDKQRLEEEKKQLQEQLEEYKLTNIKLDTVKVLEKRGLSATLVDILVTTTDIEVVQANIDKLDKAFKQAVNNAVAKKINSTGTKNSNNSSTGEVTREQFKKMNIAERTAIFKSNPELFKELNKK